MVNDEYDRVCSAQNVGRRHAGHTRYTVVLECVVEGVQCLVGGSQNTLNVICIFLMRLRNPGHLMIDVYPPKRRATIEVAQFTSQGKCS